MWAKKITTVKIIIIMMVIVTALLRKIDRRIINICQERYLLEVEIKVEKKIRIMMSKVIQMTLEITELEVTETETEILEIITEAVMETEIVIITEMEITEMVAN